MTKILLFDFSRVLLHPKDRNYKDSLNDLYHSLLQKKHYDFFEHFELNKELLNFLNTIKEKYSLYILTSRIIQNAPEIRVELKKIFAGAFSAKDFRISKKDPELYISIAKKLNRKPLDLLFIDDTIENIQAAEKAGMKTIQYLTNSELIEKLRNL